MKINATLQCIALKQFFICRKSTFSANCQWWYLLNVRFHETWIPPFLQHWAKACQRLSVTRLGHFYKFFATNCIRKVAQIFWWLFGLFLIMSLLSKKCVVIFWAIGGNYATFYSIIWSHCYSLVSLWKGSVRVHAKSWTKDQDCLSSKPTK